MDTIKVGIISDTHNLLREEVKENLAGCECIIHAGDISDLDTFLELKSIGNLIAVKGNNDKGEWSEKINKHEFIEINNHKVYVVHDIKDIPKNLNGVDLVVFGHSHKYHYEEVGGIKFLNPGSCGKKRFALPLSYVIGYFGKNSIKIERYDL